MRKLFLSISAIILVLGAEAQQKTEIYQTGGTYTFTIPCGVTSITVEAWGAGGDASGSTAGGGGAYARKNIVVISGNSYTIHVGTPSGTANTRDSYIYLNANNHLVKAAGANGGNGGTINNSIGDTRHSGGNGGTHNGNRGGGGGGSSATPTANGNNGSNATGNSGAAGASIPNGVNGSDGGNGGNGGESLSGRGRYTGARGDDGSAPGGGGGQGGLGSSQNGANGNGADGKIVITYIRSSVYCDVAFGSGTRPITLINFAGANITNSNSTHQDSYIAFCDVVSQVHTGQTYTITLKGNTDDPRRNFNTDYYTVFIDWNQDGDFNDYGEKFDIGSITSSTGNDYKQLTGTIEVPSDAQTGVTGIRVVKRYNGNVGSPCMGSDYFTYGQIIDFQIEVSSSCQQPTGATVDNQSSLTVCADINNPYSVTLRQTGGQLSTGQTWKWYRGSFPSGAAVNTNTNADGAFSTQVTETTSFYVRAEGGDCGTTGIGKTVTLTVIQPVEITLASDTGTDQQIICTSSGNIVPIVYTISDGASAASMIAGQLPAGVTGSYNPGNKTFTISGTPAQTGTFNFTISTSGNAPCTNPSVSGQITVLPKLTNVSYAPADSYCAVGGIQPLLPQLPTGQSADNFTVSSGVLPGGLSLNGVTGEISGTPDLAGTYHFKITASNGSCTVESDEITMTIGVVAVSQNLTPTGNFDLCSDDEGMIIGLAGSELNVDYALYSGGIRVSDIVAGTGSAISFTPITGPGSKFTEAGVYTAQTPDVCGTQMNGSVTIDVTPKPDATFIYENDQTTFCQYLGTSGDAIISEQPATGYFTASSGNLIFIDNQTGEIDLANSIPGTYTITYNVAASGGCALYTSTKNITISNSAKVYNLTGGGDYCAGSMVPAIVLDGSTTGAIYELYQVGNATPVVTEIGTGTAITFNSLAPGTYVMSANVGGACITPMTGTVNITENPVPAPVYIISDVDELCISSPLPLMTSSHPFAGTEQSKSFSISQNINIPDNNSTGLSILFSVTDIPIGATVTEVSVYFKTTEGRSGELRVNLKGPNGKVLNLANRLPSTSSTQNIFSAGTTFSSTSNNPITGSGNPKDGIYAPHATIGVTGAGSISPNTSDVSNFTSLFDDDPLGDWYLSFRDVASSGTSTFNEATLMIKYIVQPDPASVEWTGSEDLDDLFLDPGAELNPYKVYGGNRPVVYANPSTPGVKSYTATLTNEFGCSVSDTKQINFKDGPALTVGADYCVDIAHDNVVITAVSNKNVGGTWQWSSTPDGPPTNTNTTSKLITKTAGEFYVSAQANGCVTTKKIDVATELVVNGDFEQGNVDFETGYTYVSQKHVTSNDALYPEGTYTVDTHPSDYHENFWGVDHTTADGNGKFMIVNGYPGSGVVIWRQTVEIQPNTTYYFSAYAVSLNNVSPFAKLSFKVNDVVIGQNTGTLPSKSQDNNPGTWMRFYGTWTSGAGATSAKIEIVNLETATGGNDFGLDDISFGTLSTFFNLRSALSTVDQVLCQDGLITSIAYEAGGNGSQPNLTWSGGNPGGITPYWNGRDYSLIGRPESPGTYEYSLELEVCKDNHNQAQYLTRTGTLEVKDASDPGHFVNQVADEVAICYDAPGQIELQHTKGNILKWETSPDKTVWTDENSTATTFNYSNLTEATYVRVTALQPYDGCEEAVALVSLEFPNVWRGQTDDKWATGTNWSFGAVPGSVPAFCNDYVIVPDVGNKPYPILKDTKVVENLVIKNNAHVDLDNSGELDITGQIITSGTGHIDARKGMMTFSGTANQIISSTSFRDTTINNLYIKNSTGLSVANAGKMLAVTGTISFDNSGKLNSGDHITLKSTAGRTASLGEVKPGSTVSGKFVVERYINVGTNGSLDQHAKAWHFLATPANGQTIRQSWMENGSSPKGFGIMLTGPAGTGAGWDVFSPAPSIKSYNPATDLWVDAGSANNPLFNEHAWMAFIRGDRSVTGINDASNNTVLRSTGTLRTGNVSFSVDARPDGFAAFGNPYASAVDMRKVAGLGGGLGNATFYIWNPNFSGEYGLGAYQAFTWDGHDFISTAGQTISNFLLSGQGFFVQSFSNAYTITFSESGKGETDTNKEFFRPGSFDRNFMAELSSDLYRVGGGIIDGTLQFFDNTFNDDIDLEDGRKMLNSGINLSLKVRNKLLVVERRKPMNLRDTIFFNLTGVNNSKYRFVFRAENMEDPGMKAWLEDGYSGERTPVSLDGSTEVIFEVNNDEASKAADRFRIVFKAAPVKANFVNINAEGKNRDVDIHWSVDDEGGIVKYVVMASRDGVNFTDIGETDADGLQGYQITDQNPVDGYNYYRIRATNIYGYDSYSEVTEAFIGSREPSLGVFPNPVTNGIINLQMKNYPAGNYKVRLVSPAGQVLLNRDFAHPGGNYVEKIPWRYEMAHGMYSLQVIHPDGSIKIVMVKY